MGETKTKENLDNGEQSATATTEPAEQNPQQPITAEAPDSKEPKLAQTTVAIDDSEVTAHYANFCRVSSTPEELILDLGHGIRVLRLSVFRLGCLGQKGFYSFCSSDYSIHSRIGDYYSPQVVLQPFGQRLEDRVSFSVTVFK